ncbi:MAG: ribonuclease III [Clostridia bacterium]|nr:ribonuclease III [Clostridia bacterium]
MFPYDEIEERIKYQFKDRELLLTAFTHSTYAHQYGGADNERMEYLGDAVLQLVVTHWQYETQISSEGVLTKERQKLVCEDALLDAVEYLDLGKYLRVVGKGDNVGRKTVSSLFETLTAAIYLDGGYEAAKEFILRHGLIKEIQEVKNPKGALQEFLQQRGLQLPTYTCQKEGKDNAPVFYCKAEAEGRTATGAGKSKRAAEQSAAEKLLNVLEEEERNARHPKKRKK